MGNFAWVYVVSIFLKYFLKVSFKVIIRVLNKLDPDLGHSCLQGMRVNSALGQVGLSQVGLDQLGLVLYSLLSINDASTILDGVLIIKNVQQKFEVVNICPESRIRITPDSRRVL